MSKEDSAHQLAPCACILGRSAFRSARTASAFEPCDGARTNRLPVRRELRVRQRDWRKWLRVHSCSFEARRAAKLVVMGYPKYFDRVQSCCVRWQYGEHDGGHTMRYPTDHPISALVHHVVNTSKKPYDIEHTSDRMRALEPPRHSNCQP